MRVELRLRVNLQWVLFLINELLAIGIKFNNINLY